MFHYFTPHPLDSQPFPIGAFSLFEHFCPNSLASRSKTQKNVFHIFDRLSCKMRYVCNLELHCICMISNQKYRTRFEVLTLSSSSPNEASHVSMQVPPGRYPVSCHGCGVPRESLLPRHDECRFHPAIRPTLPEL